MIFGDPYKFAIHCDLVDDWNTDCFWVNGIYNIIINGNYVCEDINVSELKFVLANFTEEILLSMKNISLQEDCINEILNNESILNISCPEMEDKDIFVFFAINNSNDLIFFKKGDFNSRIEYSKDYILNILLSLSEWKKINIDKSESK